MSFADSPRLIGCTSLLVLAASASCGGTSTVQPVRTQMYTEPGEVAPAPNGIEFPADYRSFGVLSTAHRIDKQSMVVVIGNDIAMQASQRRETDPWPDGTIIGSIVWSQVPDSNWPTSITVDEFKQVDFMFKNVEEYANNDSGWGWARWVGTELSPAGDSKDFNRSCIACHKKVSDTDWVFTSPVILP